MSKNSSNLHIIAAKNGHIGGNLQLLSTKKGVINFQNNPCHVFSSNTHDWLFSDQFNMKHLNFLAFCDPVLY